MTSSTSTPQGRAPPRLGDAHRHHHAQRHRHDRRVARPAVRRGPLCRRPVPAGRLGRRARDDQRPVRLPRRAAVRRPVRPVRTPARDRAGLVRCRRRLRHLRHRRLDLGAARRPDHSGHHLGRHARPVRLRRRHHPRCRPRQALRSAGCAVRHRLHDRPRAGRTACRDRPGPAGLRHRRNRPGHRRAQRLLAAREPARRESDAGLPARRRAPLQRHPPGVQPAGARRAAGRAGVDRPAVLDVRQQLQRAGPR